MRGWIISDGAFRSPQMAASVGQFVVFKNSDPIHHTAHALFTSGQPQLDAGVLSRQGQPQTVGYSRCGQDHL